MTVAVKSKTALHSERPPRSFELLLAWARERGIIDKKERGEGGGEGR